MIVCVMFDKKSIKKFMKDIEEHYPAKESFGSAHVTEKGEFLYRYGSGTLPGYKKWNLSDIASFSTYKGRFSFLDREGNTMRGEYFTPSKKPLKERSYASFYVGIDQINDFVAFVKKHGPHIQHTISWKVV